MNQIDSIAANLVRRLGGKTKFHRQFSKLTTQALSEVIDHTRTGRTSVDQLEKTEKTYIGTKIEILSRALLNLSKGEKLDLKVGKHEVDVKFTVGNTWMIPMEAFNEVCLLIFANEKKNTFGVGLLKMTPANLTLAENRDRKRRVSSRGKGNILWLAHGWRGPFV